MLDLLADLLHATVASPWVYLVLFAVSAIDGFFPVVPSETLVITAGVFAVSGRPELGAVIVVAAAGAFAGDHVSYLLGRKAGTPLIERIPPGSRKRRSFDWATTSLHERGGLVLVVCRYVPGFRTATTVTVGAVRYPLRRFSLFDAVGTCSWALYSSLVGYLGGRVFEQDPIKGLLLGLGIALTITVLVEATRWYRRRRRPDPDSSLESTA
ncbi:membrane protein DedA with SNARE-associated domain [Saccharopolyspora lacisalsi]|uniref:Membrane protein DedA with SNARE-associated domain n=1 Tax=Halosaccharopolyspora lacisalsi TaxID=1000566 RepID=A0A839DR56_9PSEU|nr:DedA family protein [Halosaccharopolyspora lacisalsi]MBA8823450.1 membrane protein DedA with SNARE-associated domain [Halosaccharopolyspora lacisalsi]